MQRTLQSTSQELAAVPAHWRGDTHGLGAGGQRLKSNPGMRTAADCRETVQGARREGTAVGNAFRRKARQPWRQGATAESITEGGATTVVSLSPHGRASSLQIEKDSREGGPLSD